MLYSRINNIDGQERVFREICNIAHSPLSQIIQIYMYILSFWHFFFHSYFTLSLSFHIIEREKTSINDKAEKSEI